MVYDFSAYGNRNTYKKIFPLKRPLYFQISFSQVMYLIVLLVLSESRSDRRLKNFVMKLFIISTSENIIIIIIIVVVVIKLRRGGEKGIEYGLH
jgi:hypothetical protein